MSDRELLELAAKAAGIVCVWLDSEPDVLVQSDQTKSLKDGGFVVWNPLTDDGDALRLAVKLNIGVMSAEYTGRTCAWLYCKGREGEFFEPHGADIYAATRRAIVSAAAELGRSVGP